MQTIMRYTVLALLILTIAALSPSLVRAQTFTADEVQKLKLLLRYVRVVEDHDNKGINGLAGPHIIIEGANVHIQSGTGGTGDGGQPIGLGNLIIGYNEFVPGTTQARTGSHNLVIGAQHTYTSHGGLVAGQQNTISGPYASVSGGRLNTANGEGTSVSGGHGNVATGTFATISGGEGNAAAGETSSISGGYVNIARGWAASISGGRANKALEGGSSISGGVANTASGWYASISGGQDNTVSSQVGSDLNDIRNQLNNMSRLAALAQYVRVENTGRNYLDGPHVIFEGVNVHIQNGTGQTGLINGRGNLILGYNEPLGVQAGQRAGSHNLVVGLHHRFPKAAGIVGGEANTIDGDYAFSVGHENTASGTWSSVSGGRKNHAAVLHSSISGGERNGAYAEYSSISGGANNRAGAPGSTDGAWSSISGGEHISTGAGAEWKAGSLSMQQDTTYVRVLQIQGQ